MSKMLKVVGASWFQTKISSYILAVLGILAILALFVGQMERTQEDGNYSATLFYSEKTGYSVEHWGQSNELADIPKGIARAYFRMDINTTGWSLLEIETNGSYPDEKQAYAAGYLEGILTWYPIHIHLENTVRAICEARRKQCDKLHEALEPSIKTWIKYANERKYEDPFWHQVYLYYRQMEGVFSGWKHGVERSMNEYSTDFEDLYWLNALADITEIQQKLNISIEDPELNKLPGLSSAFLRIVDEQTENGIYFKKLYAAHNAVGRYSSMMRILKRYKLNYHYTSSNDSLPIPGNSVEFSGYPGSITSQDEFYTVRGESHKIAVIGTTLRNYNSKLWKYVNVTEELPVGPRVTAANHLATNISSWSHMLARGNSGTACKQWLIVDFEKLDQDNNKINTDVITEAIKPQSRIDDIANEFSVSGKHITHKVIHRNNSNNRAKGLLFVIEQVPSLTHSADITDIILEQGYWAAYGLPFFKDISDITHVMRMQELRGNIFSMSESPRAITFKEGFVNATTQDSILNLMRHNNLTVTDLASERDAVSRDALKYWSAVAVRGDIASKFKEPFGVIDTKIISSDANSLTVDFVAVSGPPYNRIEKNCTNEKLNRGNLINVYNDKYINEPSINGLKIHDLKNEQRPRRINSIPPFQWSKSEFNESHEGLPDKWAFKPFSPKWSW